MPDTLILAVFIYEEEIITKADIDAAFKTVTPIQRERVLLHYFAQRPKNEQGEKPEATGKNEDFGKHSGNRRLKNGKSGVKMFTNGIF